MKKIESLKVNDKRKRSSGPGNSKTSVQFISDKKQEWLSRSSFKTKLAQNDENINISKARVKKLEESSLIKTEWIIYPDDTFKQNWDLLITFILIFTCLVLPVRIAFVEEDSFFWKGVNYFIDGVFTMDIILAFYTAFYD
eukprot:CAMPEP_0170511850 /NCGR_PEP_ID=MMETSP0208-20121228/66528_1 /TAXON_ID=197538 /ORGANISM="Strombidium inclinatum, Strain S3" /LENGTH=139 /DNA_ID=CAMNT_0010795421 /DNA_START=577 /DNA_END=996 /DNA_ORIENTATION=+